MEANVQGELHLASQMLRLADARDSRLRFCSDLNSFGDCSAETIPEGVENRQHIFLTALDISGAVFDGPGLCWRSKRLRACPYLLTDPGEPGERTYLCLLILVTLQPTTVKKPPGISRSRNNANPPQPNSLKIAHSHPPTVESHSLATPPPRKPKPDAARPPILDSPAPAPPPPPPTAHSPSSSRWSKSPLDARARPPC